MEKVKKKKKPDVQAATRLHSVLPLVRSILPQPQQAHRLNTAGASRTEPSSLGKKKKKVTQAAVWAQNFRSSSRITPGPSYTDNNSKAQGEDHRLFQQNITRPNDPWLIPAYPLGRICFQSHKANSNRLLEFSGQTTNGQGGALQPMNHRVHVGKLNKSNKATLFLPSVSCSLFLFVFP